MQFNWGFACKIHAALMRPDFRIRKHILSAADAVASLAHSMQMPFNLTIVKVRAPIWPVFNYFLYKTDPLSAVNVCTKIAYLQNTSFKIPRRFK